MTIEQKFEKVFDKMQKELCDNLENSTMKGFDFSQFLVKTHTFKGIMAVDKFTESDNKIMLKFVVQNVDDKYESIDMVKDFLRKYKVNLDNMEVDTSGNGYRMEGRTIYIAKYFIKVTLPISNFDN